MTADRLSKTADDPFLDHGITNPVSEECVTDQRYVLRPSEVVQSKLLDVLPQGMLIPISCFHDRRFVGR